MSYGTAGKSLGSGGESAVGMFVAVSCGVRGDSPLDLLAAPPLHLTGAV